MAEKFGMTDFVNPTEVAGDLVPYLVNLTKGGAEKFPLLRLSGNKVS